MNSARLLVLDVKNLSILSFDTEGNHLATVIDKVHGVPDGIVVDPVKKHIYWTSMGVYHEGERFPRQDGTIQRINFDGSGHTIIVREGIIFTPKQMQIDLLNGLLYWSDREGMRVMRSKLDGAEVTTLIQTGDGDEDRKDETRHCVGIALDPENGYLYWTQKGPPNGGKGRIFRAGIDLPSGADPAHRKDVEMILDNLPEPIDLEIAGKDRPGKDRHLYWTDRGDGPGGNTLNRIALYNRDSEEHEILCAGLKEGIGLAVDQKNEAVYFTDLAGHIYSSTLEGFNYRDLYSGDRRFTGIVYVANGLTH